MNKEKFIKLWLTLKAHHHGLKQRYPHYEKAVEGARYAALGLVAVMSLFVLFVFATLPDIGDPTQLVAAQSSTIYDRNGELLYAIHGDENRKNVSFDQVSDHVKKAVLAIEDDRFYDHGGVDLPAILKSVCAELYVCSQARGGSTITQQFVKNAFLTNERTYSRKLKEIITALRIEWKYSKDEIFEMYLNRIPFGSNVYGVELAAKSFYDKSAKDLTLAEAAILAAIPKAPTYYSPFGEHKYPTINIDPDVVIAKGIRTEEELVGYDTDLVGKGLIGKTFIYGEGEEARSIYVKGRVSFVLDRMKALGMITEEEARAAEAEADTKEFKAFRDEIKAPHFVMYVREQLEAKYGKDTIEKGGLKITTTLDWRIQEAAEKSVTEFEPINLKRFDASNAAVVSVDPESGQVLAMVGSADFWNDEIDGKVNVALRPRLPGSSFKPIAYAAAFLQGYAPSTVVYDVRTKFGGTYEPENYDGTFKGPVTFRHALAHSLNIPAIKAGYFAGIPNVIDLARKMGIELNQPDDWYGLSLAIGAGEVKLLDLVLGYSVFANGGYKQEAVSILKVEDKEGNILEQYEAPSEKNLILDPQVTYLVNSVLSDVDARPEGFWRGQLTLPGQVNGAKTGTSNKKTKNINYPFDTWTVGYTTKVATGVWVGNADGKQLKMGADGINAAGGIWRATMLEATKDHPREAFDKPVGIKMIQVSKRTGKLPSENTPEEDLVTEVFASFSVPKEYDNSYQFVEIDKVSGKLATEFTPPEAREEKGFFIHHSKFPDNPIWEAPVRKWAEEKGEDELPPTEYDDVHTAENSDTKPQIVITSPSAMATVTPPTIGVWVNIDSKAGISRVDYYFDEELINTSETAPFKGTLKVGELPEGSAHKIRAVVFDDLYHSSQSEIEVRIGKDDDRPEVKFSYPLQGDTLRAGTLSTIQVDASDASSDVTRVEFFMDGEPIAPIATDSDAPFGVSFTVPTQTGEHILEARAYDYSKNEGSGLITIVVEDTDLVTEGLMILNPKKNQVFNDVSSIVIEAAIPADIRGEVKTLLVLAKKTGGRSETISTSSFENGAPQTATVVWTPSSGTYELSLKIVTTDGDVRFSPKVPVVVR